MGGKMYFHFPPIPLRSLLLKFSHYFKDTIELVYYLFSLFPYSEITMEYEQINRFLYIVYKLTYFSHSQLK